jgi:hypothetical protein
MEMNPVRAVFVLAGHVEDRHKLVRHDRQRRMRDEDARLSRRTYRP